jgi:hypothetical protein
MLRYRARDQRIVVPAMSSGRSREAHARAFDVLSTGGSGCCEKV